jgi:sec-independent protein translocase protein TatB
VFDIGFSELVVCAIVALVVIGPERMPETVRTVGLWIGRLKRSLRETRSEIERQMGMDDIRRQLHNEDIMRSLEDARRDMNNVIAQTQDAINSTAEAVYKSEPDLPYHSHTEEQTLAIANLGTENTQTSTDLPEPDVAQENNTAIIPNAAATSNPSQDTKPAL